MMMAPMLGSPHPAATRSRQSEELEGEEERDRECTNQQKTAGTKQSRAWSGRNGWEKERHGGGEKKKISRQGMECVKSSKHIFIHTCPNEEHALPI